MNQNASFYRKVAYLAALAVLLFPLAKLGAPATNAPGDVGGTLAQLRHDHNLGQADIGAIDPASETIRLATLGLRGVAVSMLWSKANEYKKTEDWTAFQSTLEQLARLQPYFIAVWRFQSWNLTYNVSVESDDVRDRFYYVKQGIKYLKDGILFNKDNPSLLDDLGWFHGNKVGRADEHEIYRKLYKNNDDEILYPRDTPLDRRDNWLVSRDWYERAVRVIDSGEQQLGTKNPTTFFDSPARSQMSYAEAIEEEGVFGPRAQQAWREGGRLWDGYGQREFRATNDLMIRLADLTKWQAEAKRLMAELEALAPGTPGKLAQEAAAKLTPEQRKALVTSPAEPDDEFYRIRDEAIELTSVTVDKIAGRIAQDDPAKASKARQLAARIKENDERIRMIDSNRGVANYDYWDVRCKIEQSPEALKARELSFEAKRLFQEEADLAGAREAYEQSFDLWSKALDKFPQLGLDSPTGSDIMDVVEQYVDVLEQMDLRLSDKGVLERFALWPLVEANDQMRKYDDDLAVYHGEASSISSVKTPASQDRGAATLVNPADVLVDPVR
jgi:hypothetical protein